MERGETSSGQRTRGLFAPLSRAGVYDWWQGLVGAHRLREEFVRRYVRPGRLPRARVLDAGCGTARLRDHLGDCEYVGVDLSERYLEAARRRHGHRGRFFRADVTLPGALAAEGPFDLVILSALLHHLDDARADALLRASARTLAADGRLISLDATITPDSHAVGRLLAAQDRGRHVRPPGEYRRLAEASFQRVVLHVRHDLLRVPYSHAILECSQGR
jgi:SAM-dependent methyltransferase